MRLTAEVPAVAERKVLLAERFRGMLAEAFAADLGVEPDDLRAELAAAAAVAGMLRLERLAVEELHGGRELPPRARLEEVFDEVERFVAGGTGAKPARKK